MASLGPEIGQPSVDIFGKGQAFALFARRNGVAVGRDSRGFQGALRLTPVDAEYVVVADDVRLARHSEGLQARTQLVQYASVRDDGVGAPGVVDCCG